MVTMDRLSLADGITIPADAKSIFDQPGMAKSCIISTNQQPVSIGSIQLSRFVNEKGLEAVGDNLFRETAGVAYAHASGSLARRLWLYSAGLLEELRASECGQGDFRPIEAQARL